MTHHSASLFCLEMLRFPRICYTYIPKMKRDNFIKYFLIWIPVISASLWVQYCQIITHINIRQLSLNMNIFAAIAGQNGRNAGSSEVDQLLADTAPTRNASAQINSLSSLCVLKTCEISVSMVRTKNEFFPKPLASQQNNNVHHFCFSLGFLFSFLKMGGDGSTIHKS